MGAYVIRTTVISRYSTNQRLNQQQQQQPIATNNYLCSYCLLHLKSKTASSKFLVSSSSSNKNTNYHHNKKLYKKKFCKKLNNYCCNVQFNSKKSIKSRQLLTRDSNKTIPANIMTSQPTASTSSNTNQAIQHLSGPTVGASSSSSATASNTMAQQGNGGGNIMSPEKREYLYKILVIGELGTGKTSFIRRYVHNFFSQNYRATIGVDFALKVLNWDQKSIIRLQLWDIAGQERFGNMTRVYYKEAAGAFIVFDVTRSATFDAVVKWKQDLDSKVQLPDGSPIPCILLANKCDQPKQGVANNSSKLDEYVKENGFAGWYETSAKDNINIEDAAKALVNKILQNDKLINSGVLIDNDKIALSGGNGGSSNRDGDSQTKKNCFQC